MAGRKRLTAIILAIIVLFAVTASLFVTAHEAGHDCIGENCPVCTAAEICRSVIRSLGCAVILAAMLFLFPAGTVCSAAFSKIKSFYKTPVSLKVKLLN